MGDVVLGMFGDIRYTIDMGRYWGYTVYGDIYMARCDTIYTEMVGDGMVWCWRVRSTCSS